MFWRADIFRQSRPAVFETPFGFLSDTRQDFLHLLPSTFLVPGASLSVEYRLVMGTQTQKGGVKRRKSDVSKARKTPPSKRKTKEAQTIAQKASYFDDIPDVAVENIVRLTSETPHNPNWTSKIPVDMVLSLLRCTGCFSRVAKCMFLSLRYSMTNFGDHGCVAVVGGRKVLNPIVLELLSELGQGLQELVMDDQRSKTLTDTITKHCTGLRRLSLSGFSSSSRHSD